MGKYDQRVWRQGSGRPHIERETIPSRIGRSLYLAAMGRKPSYCGLDVTDMPVVEDVDSYAPCARCLTGYYADEEAD
jgi:hypothetical protein